MNPAAAEVDVAVIGAGPAGCCAALRLLVLGYRVAVVERRPFPRPQIGEALSPGVGPLLQFLGAADALDGGDYLDDLSTQIIWEHRTPDPAFSDQRTGLMVDRAAFDVRLLALVRDRGGLIFQPFHPRQFDGVPGEWRITLTSPDRNAVVSARLILDAGGRSGPDARTRAPTAPPTLALWTHVGGEPARDVRVEALDRGWLWGAPLPAGGARVMAFLDPSAVKRGGERENLFRAVLAESRLFQSAAQVPFASPVQACSATPYLDTRAWQPGVIKVGETAIGLDPLSSSGVEKAVRSALQGVIAAHTMLRDPGAQALAERYYESCLIESAANHAVWARGYYARAWPGPVQTFWRGRSHALPAPTHERSDLFDRFQQACADRERPATDSPPPFDPGVGDETASPEDLRTLLRAPVVLSPETEFVAAPCVVDDRVQLRPAVMHPGLQRPVAFLGGHDLAPLLHLVPEAETFGQLVSAWAARMPLTAATRLAGWLRLRGLLVQRPGE